LVEELEPGRSFGLEEYAVSQPEDLLALRFLEPLASFGQNPLGDVRLDDWQPSVELRVIRGEGSEGLFEPKALSIRGLPEAEGLVRPIKAYVNISGSGRLISRPFLIETSGSEAIDTEVIEWLMAPETIAGLPSGYLEISIYL
jgi:hypothetical protein